MSNFENVDRELSDAELNAVQGGFLGIVDALGEAASAVGNAISDGAEAVGNAVARGARAVAEGINNAVLADVRRRFRRFF